MGTNYYHRINICEHCNRYNERHIGKSSAGWQFSFQGYDAEQHRPAIMSFEDWKRELQAEGKIFDEYGGVISLDDFIKRVEDKRSQPNNHYDYCLSNHKEQGFDMSRDWKDDEGHPFSYSEFS